MIFTLLAAAAQVAAQPAPSPAPQPAPPLTAAPLFHHRAPIGRTETVVFECEDGSRSFRLVYRHHIFERLDSAVRKGAALPPAALERANAALGRLDSIRTIIPECSPDSDLLMVVGRIGRQSMMLPLHWTDTDIQARDPFPIGD